MYDKWDNINTSSEEEVHPNIDANSFKEWKRRMKEEKVHTIQQEIEQLKSQLGGENDEELRIKIHERLQFIKPSVNESFSYTSINDKPEEVNLDLVPFVEAVEKGTYEQLTQFLKKNPQYVGIEELMDIVYAEILEKMKSGEDDAALRWCLVSTLLRIYGVVGRVVPTEENLIRKEAETYYKAAKEKILSGKLN